MKQILILERDELLSLRMGEPLRIMVGGQEITLQADVAVRRASPSKPNVKPKSDDAANWGTMTEQVVPYLQQHGPTRAVEIANALNARRTSIISALTRLLVEGKVKRKGHMTKAKWRAV